MYTRLLHFCFVSLIAIAKIQGICVFDQTNIQLLYSNCCADVLFTSKREKGFGNHLKLVIKTGFCLGRLNCQRQPCTIHKKNKRNVTTLQLLQTHTIRKKNLLKESDTIFLYLLWHKNASDILERKSIAALLIIYTDTPFFLKYLIDILVSWEA